MCDISTVERPNREAVELERKLKDYEDRIAKYEKYRLLNNFTVAEMFYRDESRTGGRFLASGDEVRTNGIERYRTGAYGAGATDIWYNVNSDAWFANK